MGDSAGDNAPTPATAPRSEHATTSRLDACERIEWLLRGVRADAARLNVRFGWRQTFSTALTTKRGSPLYILGALSVLPGSCQGVWRDYFRGQPRRIIKPTGGIFLNR